MTENKFTEIFNKKLWGNGESVSGAGSSLKYTEHLRLHLPTLLKEFKISSILDAPCGDFNWMKELLKSENINYLGGDIVKELVELNNSMYRKKNINFIHTDIIKEKLPSADLWICRDCFIHFSYEDILLTLKNLAQSEIKYVLTTTHINDGSFNNKNIETGGFRYIDLFSFPFNFPKNYLYKIDDWNPPYKPAEMILYEKNQLVDIIKTFEENLK